MSKSIYLYYWNFKGLSKKILTKYIFMTLWKNYYLLAKINGRKNNQEGKKFFLILILQVWNEEFTYAIIGMDA